MTRAQLMARVRAYTRDFSNSIFREVDVIDFINEGIDRIKEVVPELANMKHLNENTDSPLYLPNQYHILLAIYSAARCFGQDERHYQATTFMNEFETKLEELRTKIENGDITIVDENGKEIVADLKTDYVRNVYFNDRTLIDVDDGVEGVE